MAPRWRRSALSADFTGASVPSGCGRRVSLKRRSRTASDASRKTTLVGIMRPTDFRISGKLFQLGAFAHVHDQRGAANLARLHGQVGELRDQLDRKVVDAVVAQVFEGLQDRGLPRPAHAGDDDQFGRGLRWRGTAFFARAVRILPELAGRPAGLHELDSSIQGRAVASRSGLPTEVLGSCGPGGILTVDGRNRKSRFVSAPRGQVSYGVMKKFEELD